MTVEVFSNKKVSHDKLVLIGQASKIIKEYMAAGYTLTLRQLYYQFIARGMIDPKTGEPMANVVKSYKRLGDAVSDGRMLGLLDWDAIEDRTRGMERNAHWDSPADGIRSLRSQYRIDMWANQPVRVEVWIEKEALVGVIEPVCRELDLPYLACRGYVSQSEAWRAYRRLQATHEAGQGTIILHFGDHDPSGVDMTRDNRDRLELFMAVAQYRGLSKAERNQIEKLGHDWDVKGIEVRRMALTMDQVEEYDPPPNPAKDTDSRFAKYCDEYGVTESWELDALDPPVIVELIEREVDEIRDHDKWTEKEEQHADELAKLDKVIDTLEKE